MTHALLFDLDGTLVDSAPDLAGAMNHLLQHMGRDSIPVEQVRHLVGRGARYLIARGLWGQEAIPPPVGDAPFDAAVSCFLDYYRDHLSDYSRPFPAVPETLTLLQQQGYLLAVVTNKPLELTHLLLKQLDLTPFFSIVIGGDSLPQRKPEPQPLLYAMAQLGTTCHNSIMVGDSTNDVLAARAAGCPVIAVSYGYRHEGSATDLGADAIIDQFEHLPQLLAKSGYRQELC
ncbi:MAG: phosphoglycolate phosphatase [Magnetococcales bacterium]|nr:phosphoglycolate phosphatase [Magnetococcales bacterium]